MKKNKKPIRSSALSLKFANTGKKSELFEFLTEYRRVCQLFIDKFWEIEKLPRLLPKEITKSIDTWLSARMLQCCAKQASSIVRGTKQKQKQRLWMYEKLLKDGDLKGAQRLKKKIDNAIITKPNIDNLEAQLDKRFVFLDMKPKNSFDVWITLTSIGKGMKIILPVKRHKHFNKTLKRGKLLGGIRISDKTITFSIELKEVKKKKRGKTLGCDIGMKNAISTSDGLQTKPDNHGWTLEEIQKKLARKKKGSKAFERSQSHRENYINWSINQLNWKYVKEICIENMKNVRYGKRTSRYLSHFVYPLYAKKFDRFCEDTGVRLTRKAPTFTSQRCSKCGWTQRANRKGSLFKCRTCNFTWDADLNAAVNIRLNLRPLREEEWRLHLNIKGFYWEEAGKESIVPSVHKELAMS